MFAIYSKRGRTFRDSLEQLHLIREKYLSDNPNINQNVSSSQRSNLSGKAISAYREMINLKKQEPVIHAFQLMTQPVKTLHANMHVLEAQTVFQETGLQQLPVIDSNNHIVGQLSIKDLLKFIIIDGETMHYVEGKKVSDIIENDVITADPVTDIRRLAQVMQEYKLAAIPIVNITDEIVGIVSRGDILTTLSRSQPLIIWS